jgi:hypothetical protein
LRCIGFTGGVVTVRQYAINVTRFIGLGLMIESMRPVIGSQKELLRDQIKVRMTLFGVVRFGR